MNQQTPIPTPSESSPEVTVVDVNVKAIRSTPQTQYYFLERQFVAKTDEPRPIRHNITLLWCSQEPEFFICQLEDGTKAKVHRHDLKMETKESKDTE